jgi:ubiquinone/menaquinone biosynthesis C-methylase UbiE
MPILDHFGLFAPHYDRVFKPGERGWLLGLVNLPENGTLLDVGGGTGRLAQLFTNQSDQVVVADLSFEMLQQTQLKEKLLPLQTASEFLSFPTESFDRILMVDALHHVIDHQETANELWRVLKPGGYIVIEEPDVRTFGVKLLAIAEKIMGMRSHFLSPAKIAALFEIFPAQTRIEKNTDNFNAWVIITKPSTLTP